MEITCLSKIGFVISDTEVYNPVFSFLKCVVRFALSSPSHYEMAATNEPARSSNPLGQISFLYRPIISQEIVVGLTTEAKSHVFL